MGPAAILAWISLGKAIVTTIMEVSAVLKGRGASERVKKYRKFNEEMKRRKEREKNNPTG